MNKKKMIALIALVGVLTSAYIKNMDDIALKDNNSISSYSYNSDNELYKIDLINLLKYNLQLADKTINNEEFISLINEIEEFLNYEMYSKNLDKENEIVLSNSGKKVIITTRRMDDRFSIDTIFNYSNEYYNIINNSKKIYYKSDGSVISEISEISAVNLEDNTSYSQMFIDETLYTTNLKYNIEDSVLTISFINKLLSSNENNKLEVSYNNYKFSYDLDDTNYLLFIDNLDNYNQTGDLYGFLNSYKKYILAHIYNIPYNNIKSELIEIINNIDETNIKTLETKA